MAAANGKDITADYIIVGQGLAGSLVAYKLMKLGRKIVVIDEPAKNHSSLIAPGIFNPVTGQNLVKSWLTDLVFPYLHQFYPELERATGRSFFQSLPLVRPFNTIQEQNEWMGRSADPAYSEILEEVYTTSRFPELSDPYGGLMLKQCGFINVAELLEGVRSLILKEGNFVDQNFRHEAVDLSGNTIRYDGIEARKIIFCEGTFVSQNPWFNRLPVRPLKGEVLEINSAFEKHVIVNKGVYMAPGRVKGNWRIGSTYVQKNIVPGNSVEGRKEIEEKFREIFNLPYDVTGQIWGIRPTTVDRRPMLGSHPKDDRLVIFNGLGTKGVSLAPYFSEMLVHWLEGSGSLIQEVDVTRYKSLY